MTRGERRPAGRAVRSSHLLASRREYPPYSPRGPACGGCDSFPGPGGRFRPYRGIHFPFYGTSEGDHVPARCGAPPPRPPAVACRP
ncbi:predicted protein [Streptomyces sp. SPB78]|nr:predicted protein [Streptomyces sp. SPB78]